MRKFLIILVTIIGFGFNANAQCQLTVKRIDTGPSSTSVNKTWTAYFATKNECEAERLRLLNHRTHLYGNRYLYYVCSTCVCETCPTTTTTTTPSSTSTYNTSKYQSTDLGTELTKTIDKAIDTFVPAFVNWLFERRERRIENELRMQRIMYQLELQRQEQELFEQEQERIKQELFLEDVANTFASFDGFDDVENNDLGFINEFELMDDQGFDPYWEDDLGFITEAELIDNMNDYDNSQASDGYEVMKLLGEKSGLNFSDYISKERWDKASDAEKIKTMSNEELFQWHADYNQFFKDLYGKDPVLNVIEDFTNELKTELKELAITVATVLVSAGISGMTGVFLNPTVATGMKATTEVIASIAKDINRDNSIDFQKALASGANVFVGKAIKEYGNITYTIYIAGKTTYDVKGINKTVVAKTAKTIVEGLGLGEGNRLPIDLVLKYIIDI